MAIYRTIQMAFWTDPNVTDEYSPEDKLLYLYLLTNPHTNLCGCYEITVSQLANEIGYNRKKISELIDRAERIHRTIIYSKATKEVLVVNWSKYNWTASEKFRKPLMREIEAVKDAEFKAFLIDLYNGVDTVSIPYQYPIDTTVTDTDTNIDPLANKNKGSKANTVNNKTFTIVKDIYYPNDEKLDQAFRDFVDMRKMIKEPMTERAVTVAMNKLANLSGGDNDLAIRIIEESIEHNWKSFYPLKDNKKTATGWEDA